MVLLHSFESISSPFEDDVGSAKGPTTFVIVNRYPAHTAKLLEQLLSCPTVNRNGTLQVLTPFNNVQHQTWAFPISNLHKQAIFSLRIRHCWYPLRLDVQLETNHHQTPLNEMVQHAKFIGSPTCFTKLCINVLTALTLMSSSDTP